MGPTNSGDMIQFLGPEGAEIDVLEYESVEQDAAH